MVYRAVSHHAALLCGAEYLTKVRQVSDPAVASAMAEVKRMLSAAAVQITAIDADRWLQKTLTPGRPPA